MKFDESDVDAIFEVEANQLNYEKYTSAPSCLALGVETPEIGRSYQLEPGQYITIEVMTYNETAGTELKLERLSFTGNMDVVAQAFGSLYRKWSKMTVTYGNNSNSNDIIFMTLSSNGSGYFDDLSVTIRDGKLNTTIQRDDYYPFGLTFNSSKGSPKNLYTYNGKEEQEETQWLDFDTRMYDAALGRFNGIDLLSEKYSFQSPYVYAVNNPIRYVDVLGMGPGNGLGGFQAKVNVGFAFGAEFKILGENFSLFVDFGSTNVVTVDNTNVSTTEGTTESFAVGFGSCRCFI